MACPLQTLLQRLGRTHHTIVRGWRVRRMQADEVSTWVAVAQVAELVPESTRVVQAAGRELALIRTPEGFFALDNAGPHKGGPLGEGLVQGHTVTCPLHGWQFDCKTGTCLTEGKQPPQQRYAVKLEHGQVWVEVPAVRPPAAPTEWIAAPALAALR